MPLFTLFLLLLLQINAASEEIKCNHVITAPPILDTISAYGILFTVTSPYSSQITNNEMVISSLGFYVNTDELASTDSNEINYEVHTLKGHYADPDRTNGGNGGLPLNSTWDYRGNTTMHWEKIADGVFGVDDLTVWPPNEDMSSGGEQDANYFQIPFDNFQPTSIPSRPTTSAIKDVVVQSFYITLREVGALLFAPMEAWEDLHDEQNAMYCGAISISGDLPTNCINGDAVDDKPILQIGEGVVSYPFSSYGYFYQPRKFMGSIYYSNECPSNTPSMMPSLSLNPSLTLVPSDEPTIAKSTRPSHSHMPTSQPSISTAPTLPYFDADQYGCHSLMSTDREYEPFKDKTSASYGIIFPIKSNEEDDDGVLITSLGFHVDFSAVPPTLDDGDNNAVNVEVYALIIEDGLYADPNRTSAGGGEAFDYRGNFTLWKKISTDTINKGDLVYSNYFQIPFEKFEPTFVPPNGGIRSFYLTLDAGAFTDMEVKKNLIGKVQQDDDYRKNTYKDKTQHPPILLYGENVIGYPFHLSTFLYNPTEFIGRVLYDYNCPSQAPSFAPSQSPSESPSFLPSKYPRYVDFLDIF